VNSKDSPFLPSFHHFDFIVIISFYSFFCYSTITSLMRMQLIQSGVWWHSTIFSFSIAHVFLLFLVHLLIMCVCFSIEQTKGATDWRTVQCQQLQVQSPTLGQRAVRADALIDETPLNLWFAATHNRTRHRRRGGWEYNGEKRRGNLRLSYNQNWPTTGTNVLQLLQSTRNATAIFKKISNKISNN
jgi:hypothetical protein